MSRPRVAVCDWCGLAPPRGTHPVRLVSGVATVAALELCLGCREEFLEATELAIERARADRERVAGGTVVA